MEVYRATTECVDPENSESVSSKMVAWTQKRKKQVGVLLAVIAHISICCYLICKVTQGHTSISEIGDLLFTVVCPRASPNSTLAALCNAGRNIGRMTANETVNSSHDCSPI